MLLKAAMPAPLDDTAALDLGRAVLDTEIAALHELREDMDASFTQAIGLLRATTGRVVVTGIGKSGHIARKIAATLASTGTPALFVHPSEASHGDLGMVTKNDAVLALSNSGEASELGDILAYTRRFRIPLIGMTAGPDSMLARAADCVLAVPRAEEACPMGLAPTSSTTMMLALGDALAITLLKLRGFDATDYKVFHPGGKLGKRLQLVQDLMHTGSAVPLAEATTPMRDVILLMTEKTFGCCGVVDNDGKLAGIITDGDLRRHMDGDLLALNALQVMTHKPKTIAGTALAAEAVGRMNDSKVTALFVTGEDSTVLGIVRLHDLLKAGVV